MDDIRLLQISMICYGISLLILWLYVVFLQKRVKELENRETALSQAILTWGGKIISAELKTTAPPEIIVESESAFQRYQRGKLG